MTERRKPLYWSPPVVASGAKVFSEKISPLQMSPLSGNKVKAEEAETSPLRMFPRSRRVMTPEELDDLAKVMTAAPTADDARPTDHGPGNPLIPAGYTYFAQFVDHDVSFTTVKSFGSKVSDRITKARDVRLDLDMLYGGGPEESPDLYESSGVDAGVKLRVGKIIQGTPPPHVDLLRVQEGEKWTAAVLVDDRDDDNLIVAQIHSAFIAFHNRMVDELRPTTAATDLFDTAVRRTRWHYQWLVLWDLLPRLCGGVGEILAALGIASVGQAPKPPLKYYGAERGAYVPVEFSHAAYRFGHSMVRSSYFLNSTNDGPLPQNRVPIVPYAHENPMESLLGGHAVPAGWGLGWHFFFPFTFKPSRAERITPTSPANMVQLDGPQQSHRIDHEIVHRLKEIPTGPGSTIPLIRLDLKADAGGEVATGQQVAEMMGVASLTEEQLKSSGMSDGKTVEVPAALLVDTPLTYYILKEAELEPKGLHLGPVGRRILIETFVGLLWNDRDSLLHNDPAWRPYAGRVDQKRQPYTMSHLLRYAFRLNLMPDGPWPPGAPLVP